jgi:hypothetical protein
MLLHTYIWEKGLLIAGNRAAGRSADKPASLQLLNPNGAGIGVGGGQNAGSSQRAWVGIGTSSLNGLQKPLALAGETTE